MNLIFTDKIIAVANSVSEKYKKTSNCCRILSEGETAVKDYLGFLSGGCSKTPIDLLKGAGVDMTSPAPVNQALELFGKLLDEMEELMAE